MAAADQAGRRLWTADALQPAGASAQLLYPHSAVCLGRQPTTMRCIRNTWSSASQCIPGHSRYKGLEEKCQIMHVRVRVIAQDSQDSALKFHHPAVASLTERHIAGAGLPAAGTGGDAGPAVAVPAPHGQRLGPRRRARHGHHLPPPPGPRRSAEVCLSYFWSCALLIVQLSGAPDRAPKSNPVATHC